MSEALSHLIEVVAQHADALTPSDISVLLRALAARKLAPSEAALSALLGTTGLGASHGCCSPLMPLALARAHALVTVLHSLAHLPGYSPHPRWLAAAAHALRPQLGSLQDMSLQQSSSLLWSLAKLKMYLPR
jgi:hypothetical protein